MPGKMPPNRRDDHLYNDFSRLNNELANAQRELAQKNAELELLNRQKNQFLGMAAHDLRNPLQVILLYSRFLLEETDSLTEEQIEFINVIQSSSSFMLDLVNDFLDFSKIEAGKLELNLSQTNLINLIQRSVELNQVLAAPKQIQIVFNRADNFPEIILDESKIEQVLNNLLGNAVKFSPIGGRIEVCTLLRDGGAVISIEDEGEGIPIEKLEILFKPFERGTNPATAGEKSAGLGLAIVKKIVEGHGGEISVKSEPGKGTIFHVFIPVNSAKKFSAD
jgi:two-component system, OmpR family, sensor kinase